MIMMINGFYNWTDICSGYAGFVDTKKELAFFFF
jgi:hypothetical protein